MTQKIICPGFEFSGVAAGLKKNGGKDLGLIYSEVVSRVAGIFTTNHVKAAPVLLDMERINAGICKAVIVNSGNANCCTGEQGMTHALAMTRYVADKLNIVEAMVLAASTGVIGVPMPIEKIEAASTDLINNLMHEGIEDFAGAIMTTDTIPKIVSRQGTINDKPFTVTGVAKGAGMICPNMATMLCFICTDADAEAPVLKESLMAGVDKSFNRITIDGDTSTNDTVLLMANGVSGAKIVGAAEKEAFQAVLDEVMLSLAKMVVKDGEGATKLVEIIVKGAVSDKDARTIARTIANSSLVKTALFGQDANWGRVLAAAGRSGVPIEPNRIDLYFNDVLMVKKGTTCGQAAEAEATKILKMPEFSITIDLHIGKAGFSVFTCDFSIDYVKINADYRS
ncbi:MAG: bifunctional ornithine acetyltransferase/N-acetylglutamate synthase [Desulfobacteraceae bacterium IS3]|nr:MAG: bifunctional ornithine acetyltransferase/N-acetylglutamate synthase [Desulfobacteraceae bacterium IS3]